MTLLGRPIHPTASPASPVVTINPRFTSNIQSTRDCEKKADLPAAGGELRLPAHRAQRRRAVDLRSRVAPDRGGRHQTVPTTGVTRRALASSSS